MLTAKPVYLRRNYDVVVVGSGPAGMAAALGAQETGAEHILIVDREKEAGGILQQCIHMGFGLHHFGEELTGPEYAQRFLQEVYDWGIDVLTDTFVVDINGMRQIKLMSGTHGIHLIQAKAVVLAMGARERTRGAIRIPGTRPAGVLTAGLAQKFVNLMGYLPGRNVVILGSGDIGMIMARRLTLEGVKVHGVYEIMPYPNGLSRNIVQCLQDFDIPLHLSTTVTEIKGKNRVEAVTVAPVDEAQQPIMTQKSDIDCNTLMLSIGLIPENELSQHLKLRIDPLTGGPVVDSCMETSMNGVFACGNVLHIHDLVDFVTEEAFLAGRSAGEEATGKRRPADNIRLMPGENVGYCVPQTISTDRDHRLYLRVKKPLDKCTIRFGDVFEKKLRYVFPAETVNIKATPHLLQHFHGGALHIDIVARS